jgi:hypothetical protein
LISLASVHLPAADPARGGIIFGGVTFTEAQAADLLAGLNYVNLHTATNAGGEIRGQLIPVLNLAPTVTCPAPASLECARATVTVNVTDADGDALEVVWTVNGTAVQTNRINAGTPPTMAAVSLESTFASGESQVSVSVSDGTGGSATCSTRITVQDATPPVVQSVTASPGVLWPPNHRMVSVQLQIDATDACGAVGSRIISVASNEPVNGIGDGNTEPDWMITGDHSVDLRAERSGPGRGRVYTIQVEVEDEAGNRVVRETTVAVPHDQGKRKEAAARGVAVPRAPSRSRPIQPVEAEKAGNEMRKGTHRP